MKIIRNIVYEAFLLYILATFVGGLVVYGGFLTYLWAGFVLALCAWIVRPVLNLITLPIALISLGLSRILTNALILLVVTKVVPDVVIRPFVFHQVTWSGFVIPTITFSYFMAFVVIAVLKSLLQYFINWVGSE